MKRFTDFVEVFDICGERKTLHSYNSSGEARAKFRRVVDFAENCNIGKVDLLTRVEFTRDVGPSWNRRRGTGFRMETLDTWTREPDLQVEGYVVHSARALRDGVSGSGNTFYKTQAQAVAAAKKVVKNWGAGHEGAIVFKAIKHVHRGDGIVVYDLD